MKLSRQTHRRKAFTLVELLTVIAIIGILAALIIPAVGKVQEEAKKTAAASDGRQVGLAYNTFANSGGRSRNIKNTGEKEKLGASTVGDYAWILAKFGGLNDASIWYIDSDDALAAATIPETVLNTAGDDHRLGEASPVSWGVVTNLSKNAPTSTTPMAATRGLGTDGSASEWDDNSPWRGDGGHVIFLDGHVVWHQNFTLDPLLTYGESTTANKLSDAVNTGAVYIEDAGGGGEGGGN